MIRLVSTLPLRLAALSGWRRFALSFVLGLGAAAAMAPYYLLPLLIIGFIALVWLIDGSATRSRPGRSAFWTGFAFALGYLWLSMYWLAFSFMVHATGPGHLVLLSVMGFAGVFGASAFIALFYAAAMAIAIRFWRSGWERVLAFAVFWSLAEYARGHVLTGFPWNLTGQALGGATILMQPVAWIGTYGLGFVVLFAAALPAAIVERDGTGRRVWALIVSAAIWLAIPLFSVLRLAGGEAGVNDAVRIQVVQPNIAQTDKINPERFRDNFLGTLALTGGPEVLAAGAEADDAGADDGGAAGQLYVIWPENAAYQYGRRDPEARSLLQSRLPANSILVTGDVRIAQDGDDYRFYNSLSVLADRPLPGDGDEAVGGWSVARSYDKHHLAPFGEYIPLQGLFEALGIGRIVPMGAGFTPGEGPVTIDLGAARFSPIICYETIFPGEIYPRAERPDFLVTVTNDAWFGDTAGPRQHFDMSRLRAVEAGLPMARAANTGISAIIDAHGRVLSKIDLYERGAIVKALPRPLQPTLYHYVGDILYYVLIAIAAIWVITSSNPALRQRANH